MGYIRPSGYFNVARIARSFFWQFSDRPASPRQHLAPGHLGRDLAHRLGKQFFAFHIHTPVAVPANYNKPANAGSEKSRYAETMRLLHRATGWTVIFLYTFGWRCFISFTLPALLAGILGFELVSDLPPARAIPAALMLAALVAIAWRQWWRTESLRERIRTLEDDADGLSVYETSNGGEII